MLMERHGLKDADVARIVGATETAVRAWKSGKKHIPPAVERLLLIVLDEAKPEDYR
jgi:DNA-binding transcriptional regulator YiaG